MPKLSVVLPAYNEEGNIKRVIRGIWDALIPLTPDLQYEVVVVDDGDDRTSMIAKSQGARVIRGRRLGLAQAVLDGIDQSEGDYIIVQDSDGQHPSEVLPKIVRQLRYHDLVVVTKHAKSSKADMTAWRKLQSTLGVLAAQQLVPAPVSDPMTGFFGIRRKCLDGIPRGEYYKVDGEKAKGIEVPKLRNWGKMSELERGEWYCRHGVAEKKIGIEAIGFKIGLELFAKANWVTHCEIPMAFLRRQAGVSKGTMHSLHKHLYRLFNFSLDHDTVLPKGSEEYFNFYEGGEWQKEWKQSIALKLQEITNGIKSQKVLDIGCGSSPNINYIRGERVGMDINEKALEFMRGYSDAEFVKGSVLSIPFPDKSFDTVLCVEVIEHLFPHQVDRALSEIARVLRDKGHAVIATPNYSNMMWNIIEKAQILLQPGHWTSDHHTQFNHKSLGEWCAKAGLKEVGFDFVMSKMDMVGTFKKE